MRLALLLGLPALLLCAGPLHAASTSTRQQAAVSPELLEFLADWQGADGNWVDPMTFAHIDPAKLAKPGKPAPVPARGTASASPAAALNSR